MDKIKSDCLYKINTADVAFREIEDKVLMIVPDSEYIYELNDTGKTIWQLILRKQTLSTIIKNFARQYGLSLEKADKEVRGFAEILEKKKIIRRKNI